MKALAFTLFGHASPPTSLASLNPHLITFFFPPPAACSHSPRCAGDTNAKWNLIPPLCIFARANPGFLRVLCWSVSCHNYLRLASADREIVRSLFSLCRNLASRRSSSWLIFWLIRFCLRGSENNPFISNDTGARPFVAAERLNYAYAKVHLDRLKLCFVKSSCLTDSPLF